MKILLSLVTLLNFSTQVLISRAETPPPNENTAKLPAEVIEKLSPKEKLIIVESLQRLLEHRLTKSEETDFAAIDILEAALEKTLVGECIGGIGESRTRVSRIRYD